MTAPLSISPVSINPTYVPPEKEESQFLKYLLEGANLQQQYQAGLTAREANALRKQELDANAVAATQAAEQARLEGEAIRAILGIEAGDAPGGGFEPNPNNPLAGVATAMQGMDPSAIKGAWGAVAPRLDLAGKPVEVIDRDGRKRWAVIRNGISTIVPDLVSEAGIDPQQEQNRISNEAALADDFRTQTAPYAVVALQVEAIRNSAEGAKKKIPAAQMSLVFGYMKLLDPNSSVREGEYASAEQARGVPASVMNTYNKIIDGAFLTPTQVDQFLHQADQLSKGWRTKLKGVMKQYEYRARKDGMDPRAVVFDYFGDTADDKTKVTAPAAPGQLGNAAAVFNKLKGKP